jgi:FMN phosphatase YigB (HAD superfamily)
MTHASNATLAVKNYWILDNDGSFYPTACGLHPIIKASIIQIYGQVAKDEPRIAKRFGEIMEEQGHKMDNPAVLTMDSLGLTFPPLVRALKEVHPERLHDYLIRFYGENYTLIPPSPEAVEAFRIAREKGVKIFFYSNGPSSPVPGEMGHLQKTMRALGFDHETIEYMRPRAYDLLKSVEAGRGKPTADSLRDFLTFSRVIAKQALMADDGVHNLKTAAEQGIMPLWTHTTDDAPDPVDTMLAKQLGALRVRDTGKALLQIAQARA